ncbi:kinesin family member 22, isoform CRA_e [Rattus norvegicus]|uniref:Kinesin family member 22, isoform CRA_e n=1 Tax=Rattus norvegicus TaxID=10116 RepID=A6I9K8_RAT|nr:kinesin family member 22, isoform CRA_e [Rattus norvegicus]
MKAQLGICEACSELARRRPSSLWAGGSCMAPLMRWRTWNRWKASLGSR